MRYGKNKKFLEDFDRDGFNFFILCDFLAQEIVKDEIFKKLLIGRRKVENQLDWLTEHLYWFNLEEYNSPIDN